MQRKVIIGTRGSKLALWQAHFTKDKLKKAGYDVVINVIKTKGDKIQHLSFDKIEGKGFFTKEIEDSLLNNEVDLAVHSCKDLPTESPEGLTIAAYSARAAAQDVLLINKNAHDSKQTFELMKDPIVGTSSARRKAQIAAFRPDVKLKDIRGNVPTRINKLRQGTYDGILLAAAGLDRLELDTSDLIRIDLDPIMFVPAPAQGILAYQIRTNDTRMAEIVQVLNDEPTKAIIDIERKILNAFQGGCQIPLGVYAREEQGVYRCWVSEAKTWDSLPIRMSFTNANEIAPQKVIEKFGDYTPKSVFISKDVSMDSYFSKTLETTGNQLFANSLIDFNGVDFDVALNQYDWVFFSSKNGVKYFFDAIKTLPESIKVGAINKGSASVVKALGYKLDFVGEGGSLDAIAKNFDNTNGVKTLFVRAKVSNRTIQKQLVKKEIEDVVVYDNFIKPEVEERNESILVFTSPMNVEAYCSKYKLKANQKLIAIGASTQKAIESHNYSCKTAYEPTMWSLLDEIFSV